MKSNLAQPRTPRRPKYQRVLDTLRRQIADGTLRPGSQLPPENRLPGMFKVSELTIRRALSELTREGLIVRRRGSGSFVTDRTRPPLIPGRTLRLGILYAHPITSAWLSNGPIDQITLGILDEWGLKTATPQRLSLPSANAGAATWIARERNVIVELISESAETELRHPPLQAVCERGFDGIITQSIVEEEWLEELLKLGVPTVIADFSKPRFGRQADQVFFDPHEGYSQAVRYLAGQGFKRIHFVGCFERVPAPNERMSREEWLEFSLSNRRVCLDSFARLNVFRQELRECGLPVREDWIHLQSSTADIAPYLAALPEDQRPDAVVCHGSYQVDTIKRAFSERGLPLTGVGATTQPSAPDELIVLADGKEIGAAAAALLLSRIQRPTRPTLRVGVTMSFKAGTRAN
jgi:DNA-binding LacI/PurR family transcriptional regulator